MVCHQPFVVDVVIYATDLTNQRPAATAHVTEHLPRFRAVGRGAYPVNAAVTRNIKTNDTISITPVLYNIKTMTIVLYSHLIKPHTLIDMSLRY